MSEIEARPQAGTLQKRIEERAYALWEAEGRRDGRALDHWLQAEVEITAAGDIGSGAAPPDPTASPASPEKGKRAA